MLDGGSSEEQSSVLEEKKNGEMGTKKRHEENCEIEGEIMVKWGESGKTAAAARSRKENEKIMWMGESGGDC